MTIEASIAQWEPADEDVRLALLLDTVGELSKATRLDDVQQIVRSAARGLVRADGATFVLRDLDKCFYADEDAISPLWKGQRFPLETCISGWAMINREAVAIPDIYVDSRIPHDAYRPTFVKSLVMVPIRRPDPIGAIGMYWAQRHDATIEEIRLAQALADSTSVALEHVRVLRELAETVELSTTDALTGLPNRRAWDQALSLSLQPGREVSIALVALDDFTTHIDTKGRQAGDAHLCRAAEAWRRALRARDLLARYGGEHFAVLLPDCAGDLSSSLAERVRSFTPAGSTASVGLANWDGVEGPSALMARADRALYEAKNAGRDRVRVAA